MNFRKTITLSLALLGVAFILISCRNNPKNTAEHPTSDNSIAQISTNDTEFLLGAWKDESKSGLHFSLNADSTLTSYPQEIIGYKKWYVKTNQLYLTTLNIENGSSIVGADVYDIQELNESEMSLKKGEVLFQYKKSTKSKEEILNENPPIIDINATKIVKGRLILGHEEQSFYPCESDADFWILGDTELSNLYHKLTKEKKPYWPIFVEIEIMDHGKALDGFAAEYDSTYEIVTILQARELLDSDCK
ncbi:lipocalin family protein [Cellulophaga sp. L1A9]|uniref:lipocalin family protein n=1 Tax=Cellulophaga sp. L1A9 TaxID=2686362 RepID=UPI00131D8CAB|nr:lipocalin family protein [Cellulophaga sp. L1A9]